MPRLPLPALLLCLLSLWLTYSAPALAELKLFGSQKQSFLPAEQALKLETQQLDDRLILKFRIVPGHYLYRDRFRFESQSPELTVGPPEFPRQGEWKEDASFGRVQVFHEDVEISLPLQGRGDLKITWQGCADAGLCYPPQSEILPVAAIAAATSPAAVATTAATPNKLPNAAASGSSLFQGASHGAVLLGLFVLGLGLAFTPCVLPLLPILSGIIARQHEPSGRSGFLLSLAYVLGVASTYALTGLLVGAFGASANLPVWFQHPVVLSVFAALFVLLALSMFGLFELQLPHGLQNRLDALGRRQQGGQYVGSYIMGFFSALVVSPCVSAPLAGVLLYISTTGNAGFGALALFVLALGMGIPLLLLGLGEGRWLPKAGDWMIRVKVFFGVLLLAVAISLLARILPGTLALLLWAALAAVSAVWLGALEPVQPGPGHFWKGLGILLLIYSAALVIGAATGHDDPLKPLGRFGQANAAELTHTPFQRVTSLAELKTALAAAKTAGKPVMLDFYADWCVSCKVMERDVFQHPEIAPLLRQLVLLQADVTANNAEDRALLQHFGLFGPPAMLFFKEGAEIPAARLQGELTAQDFGQHLQQWGM